MNGGNAVTDFFGGLFDTARGVFREITDFELSKAELELEKERRKQEGQDLRLDFPSTTMAAASNGGGGVAGFNATTLILVGVAGVAVLWALRS